MLLRGQTLRLSCLAEASPAPVYTWLQRTASGDLRLRSSEVSDTGDLVLEDVSYGDSGEFLCRASNTVAGQPRAQPQVAGLLSNVAQVSSMLTLMGMFHLFNSVYYWFNEL